jgi:hypothetical protein
LQLTAALLLLLLAGAGALLLLQLARQVRRRVKCQSIGYRRRWGGRSGAHLGLGALLQHLALGGLLARLGQLFALAAFGLCGLLELPPLGLLLLLKGIASGLPPLLLHLGEGVRAVGVPPGRSGPGSMSTAHLLASAAGFLLLQLFASVERQLQGRVHKSEG